MSQHSLIPNEMILASAGSGKTYQLTNRYIALMALQLKSGSLETVHPERIIAVTFTRKAAGEFFDAILVKLAKAATNPNAGSELAGAGTDILSEALRSASQEDFLELLRLFIQRMPRLFLGTLDSFFSNILRSFPSEFGLTSDFEVMDDYRTASAIDRVYESVFSHRTAPGGDRNSSHETFLEAFRLATFGKEESNVIRSLDEFVEKLHNIYLDAPDEKFWGDPRTIWNASNNRWLVDGVKPGKEFSRLFAAFDANPDQVHFDYWNEFRDEVSEHRPGAPFGKRTKYMLPRFLDNWRDLENGSAAIKFGRTVHEFSAMDCEAICRITQWLVGGELKAKLQRTRGVWELLERYEQTYAERVRRQGQLTFQDVQLLLAGNDSIRTEKERNNPPPLLTQQPESDDRLRIDYRLDARYDHWLLDEFQDTNFTQWKVIRNLIDEVVQDASGTRSLFQVGDVKQAIYGWRGGDTRLFTDIGKRYNAVEERIQERALDISYRSVASVLDPVNSVFRDKDAMKSLELPDATINRWIWNDHKVAPGNASESGYTALLHPRSSEEGKKPGQEDIYELVLGILKEIEPSKHGLSCAILVRTNDRGNEIVDYIRAHSNIAAVSESEQKIASDNPVNLALMSLFQLAAHPGDTFAWEHLCMTPFREKIEKESLSAGFLSRQTATRIFESNFELVVRETVAELEALHGGEFDAFTKSRTEAFALAARLYDETGSRDIDDFLAYAGRHTTREAVDASAVQVMTYHKSKGLTFDMVILPELKSDSLTSTRLEIGAKSNEDREVQWVLDMPGKDIVAADPVLGEYLAEKQAESAYESLCMYYVGMTRARYANYLVTIPQGPRSKSMNFVKLLEDTIAGEPEEETYGGVSADRTFQSTTGTCSRTWFESRTKPTAAEDDTSGKTPEPVEEPQIRFRPRRRTPSGDSERILTAQQILQPAGEEARSFGTLVHAIFEEVEWANTFHPDTLSIPHKQEDFQKALDQVTACLKSESVRKALSPPDSDLEKVTLWREKNFEILIGNEWLSGTFDRVVIQSDAEGRPSQATIIDFKTDQITEKELSSGAEHHRSQMETYRTVLSKLTKIPTRNINLQLIFTRIPDLAEL